jgi:hypothetical protein
MASRVTAKRAHVNQDVMWHTTGHVTRGEARMNTKSEVWEMCANCRQHILLSRTPYDVIMRPDGSTVYAHHSSCTRIYLMNHTGYVVEEVLHHQEALA